MEPWWFGDLMGFSDCNQIVLHRINFSSSLKIASNIDYYQWYVVIILSRKQLFLKTSNGWFLQNSRILWVTKSVSRTFSCHEIPLFVSSQLNPALISIAKNISSTSSRSSLWLIWNCKRNLKFQLWFHPLWGPQQPGVLGGGLSPEGVWRDIFELLAKAGSPRPGLASCPGQPHLWAPFTRAPSGRTSRARSARWSIAESSRLLRATEWVES